ncbi:hypothetical protein AB0L44_41785 [Nonomuraea wenchangensis]|uniref:zinc finger domain-containing protein n=1 Tax=Nonomuraea wenchangensis TaxID=568860 RepID=UPI0034313B5B
MTDPQQPSPTDRSDADDVEQHVCPKCDAQPGSPCRSRGGAVASAYHTRRFTMVPRLKKALRVPTPADRGPGRPWRHLGDPAGHHLAQALTYAAYQAWTGILVRPG